jgi:hypothetical protein
MINAPFILLILNCEKYRYKSDIQRETWLKNFPIPYFHIIGNPELCHDYQFDHDNHLLYVKTKDDYLSLPHKIIMAMNAIHNTYDYLYIFKTDDNVDFTNKLYFTTLMNMLSIHREIHYGGHKVMCGDFYSTHYDFHNELPRDLFMKSTTYCSGKFYFLSREAISNLLLKMKDIKNTIIEDHSIGLYLDEMYKQNLIHIETDIHFVRF